MLWQMPPKHHDDSCARVRKGGHTGRSSLDAQKVTVYNITLFCVPMDGVINRCGSWIMTV
jgi:hypothetical protein